MIFCLRNYLLFFALIIGTMNAMEEKLKKPIPSLQKLCIREILAHPREYIKRDAVHKLPKNMEECIADRWYTAFIQLRFQVKEIEDLNTGSPDFLSRILLIEVCNKSINQLEQTNGCEKIKLTEQEEKIFNDMPEAIQENMKYYVLRKSSKE